MQNTGLVFKMFTDTTNYSRGLKKAGSELDQFKNMMGKIGGAIAGAFAANEIVQFGKEAVMLAGQAEAVEKAFSRIGGSQYLDAMRSATRGTVADLELMKRAVSANNFEIPLESLAGLFEFARRRAEETGQSVDYLVDSIVTGIGRKSPLILDNLGISAVALKEKLGGVSMEAANISDVATAVGQIATAELAKMGVESETTQQKMAAITTEFQNMKLEIGKAISESDLFKISLSGVGSIFEKIKNRNAQTDARGLALIGTDSIDLNNIQQVSALLDKVKQTQQGLASQSDTWIDRMLSPTKAAEADKLRNALNPLFQTLSQAQSNLNIVNSMIALRPDIITTTKDNLTTATGLYGRLAEKVKAYKEQLEAANSEKTIRFLRNKIELLEAEKDYYDSIGKSLQKMQSLQQQGKGMPQIKTLAPIIQMQARNTAGPMAMGTDAPSLYELQETATMAADLLSNFRDDILGTAAEGFGLMLTGDMGLSGFFNGILMLTADFAKQFGRLLISIGLAKISLEKLGISGIGAVIAGTALLVAAGAISGLLAKSGNMQGLATGTNYVPEDGPYYLHKGESVVPKKYNPAAGGAGTSSQVTVSGRISGRDIRLTQSKENWYNSRVTGS